MDSLFLSALDQADSCPSAGAVHLLTQVNVILWLFSQIQSYLNVMRMTVTDIIAFYVLHYLNSPFVLPWGNQS